MNVLRRVLYPLVRRARREVRSTTTQYGVRQRTDGLHGHAGHPEQLRSADLIAAASAEVSQRPCGRNRFKCATDDDGALLCGGEVAPALLLSHEATIARHSGGVTEQARLRYAGSPGRGLVVLHEA